MTEPQNQVPGTINYRLSKVEKGVRKINEDVAAIKSDMVTRTTVRWLVGILIPTVPGTILLMFYIGERLWG